VEAHPAIPKPQQLPTDKSIARKIGKDARDAGVPPGIKRGIAQSTAKDYSQHAIEDQIISMALRHRSAGLFQRL